MDASLNGVPSVDQLADQRIELKFVLDDSLAKIVRDWARQNLGVDSHCDPLLGDSYEVSTLYLDSPELDIFHRREDVGLCKHRLRRYGVEHAIWLETKRKRNSVVTKNRTVISEDKMPTFINRIATMSAFASGQDDAAPWCGDWFTQRIIQGGLQPTVMVHYRRFARTATINGENLRLTIDSNLQGAAAIGWYIPARDPSVVQTISDCHVLELKFHDTMPALFKQLLQEYSIVTSQFSKFRSTVMMCCNHASFDQPDSCNSRVTLLRRDRVA